MSKRTLPLFLLAASVIGAILLMRSCQDGAQPGSSAPAAQTRAADNASGALDPTAAAAEARALAISTQRNEAMYAAVSTLHRYLAALPGDDRAKADAFWAGRAAPEPSGEADLRRLEGLRSLRIENGTPKALDAEPVPNALEIPVTLRASLQGQPLRNYRGWYRLRRAVVDDSWEITSAAIEAYQR